MKDDAVIINNILKEGDRGAYGELVEKYSALVFGTCLSILGNREDAADVTQEAFVKAYRILPDLREPERFSLWLRRIAVGMCKNLIRAESRRTGHLQNLAAEPAEQWEKPEAAVSAREQSDVVRRQICTLPERYRTVIILKYLEGLRYSEIASFLGVSERTVKTISLDAKRLLTERLKKQGLLNVTLFQSRRMIG